MINSTVGIIWKPPFPVGYVLLNWIASLYLIGRLAKLISCRLNAIRADFSVIMIHFFFLTFGIFRWRRRRRNFPNWKVWQRIEKVKNSLLASAQFITNRWLLIIKDSIGRNWFNWSSRRSLRWGVFHLVMDGFFVVVIDLSIYFCCAAFCWLNGEHPQDISEENRWHVSHSLT